VSALPPEPTAPASVDPWAPLRASTPARIGLGRAGDALPTARLLELRLAHARARDAVHEPLDVGALSAALGGAAVVASAAADRPDYLRRPDLGRRPAVDACHALEAGEWDIATVLADGLSPRAVEAHGPAMVAALRDALPGRSFAPPVVATQARVALGDWVGAALGARLVLVLIGERPGLSAADSLGVYLTYGPRPGRSDAERNCVSNIRPPHGLSYARAAGTVAALVRGADALGRSGVALKDGGADVLPAGAGDATAPDRVAGAAAVPGSVAAD
jgi:ethanolamine ammonia-lyase small subunit